MNGDLKGDELIAKFEEEDRRENFYHGLVLGLLASPGPSWVVDSNREYGRGRPDIVVINKGSDPVQADFAIVLEFKHGTKAGEVILEDLARTAFAQADAKYLNGIRDKWHPKRLLVLGAGFVGKELLLYFEA